jgi:N-acetylmuramoyl-L-alanine amidase
MSNHASSSGEEARIQLIYPKLEQEIYEDSSLLMGCVIDAPPNTYLELSFQDQQVPVSTRIPLSSQGFFAWKIPIHAGMNPMELALRQSSATPPKAQLLFALHGATPWSVLPSLPLALHEETLLPETDVWLRDGDSFTVACSASRDAQVFLDIPGFLLHPLPIFSASHNNSSTPGFVDTREPIFAQLHWNSTRIPMEGYYSGKFSTAEILYAAGITHFHREYLDLPLVLQLRHGEHVLKHPLNAKLSLITHGRSATVSQDRAVTRTAPENGARLTPQRLHTQVWIDGLKQGWARVRLSQHEAFYLPLEALTFLATKPQGTQELTGSQSLVSIHSKRLSDFSSEVTLIFSPLPGPEGHACPIQIEVVPSAEMNRLQVRLYGVCSRCDFIHYPPDDGVVRQIHWRPVADDVLELWIDLHHAISGYDYAWENGQWRFKVKVPPHRLEEVRVLIDPGHGGTETGSTGLNGLPEKTLNLTVSQLLQKALLEVGFRQVTLTRDTDDTLSLQDRGQQAIETVADLVLSIHHNALPDGRDPLQVEGASCFYYQPFAKTMAEALLNGLTERRHFRFDVPNYGLFYDSLAMTRIHQATAVLVEVGFFTNPDEFERLINPDFQQEISLRLASALRNYCLPQ